MNNAITSLAVLAGLCGQAVAQESGISEPLTQPQPSAYVSMTNLGGAFDFDESDWRAAVAGSGTRIFWKIDRDSAMAERVMEVAASVDDAPPFAALYSVNLRPDQAADFDRLLDSIVENDAGGDFAGSEFVMRAPLCRLMRLPAQSDDDMRLHYVATIDRSEDRRACYATTIAHLLANADDFQPPPLKRVVIDGTAIAVQEVLPEVAVKEEDFIEADTWKNDRRAVPRDGGSVFAPQEMIMLHAVLENIGRDMPGTALATYEIKLDVRITDAQGNLIADQEDAMRFSGSAIHSVPIRPDYFETGVVAGFPLPQPGEYEVRYRLTDMNRPEEKAVVEIVKQVIVR